MPEHFLIEHQGTIVAIHEGLLKVEIKTAPACGSCEAKAGCLLAENGYRYIEVPSKEAAYRIGDIVTVVSRASQGWKAVLWGYGFPFLLVLTVLILAHIILGNELWAGLAACFSLVFYYTGLFLFRDHFKKAFTFTLKSE